MPFKTLAPSFSATSQLTPDDMAAAAAAGFRSIISSRPDAEEPGQRSADEMAGLQRGLAFAHVPVVPGKATDDDIDKMKEALAHLPKPILGFCRTGTRAATLWALVSAESEEPRVIIETAQGVGYDLSSLTLELERRARSQQGKTPTR